MFFDTIVCFIVYTGCNPLHGNFRTATTTRRAQTTLGSSWVFLFFSFFFFENNVCFIAYTGCNSYNTHKGECSTGDDDEKEPKRCFWRRLVSRWVFLSFFLHVFDTNVCLLYIQIVIYIMHGMESVGQRRQDRAQTTQFWRGPFSVRLWRSRNVANTWNRLAWLTPHEVPVRICETA